MSWIDKLHAPNKGLRMHIVSYLLLPISWLYGLLIKIRNSFYNLNWFKSYRPCATVVSVGNIVAGGVGKTPLTLKIAKHILEEDLNLAILSRGYLSKFEHKKKPTLISSGEGPLYSAHHCGDEPYLISKNVPKAHFYVGKNRVHSAKMADKSDAHILLLDDAMQYRKLHRDIEIVVLDAKDPFGKGHFLPRGFLREPLNALSRADYIVINHVEDIPSIEPLIKILKSVSRAPQILTRVETQGVFDLQDQQINSLKGVKVGAFCGLAKPNNFFKTLKSVGAEILIQESLGDHRKMGKRQLQLFCQKALKSGARYLICSEKDAVKLPIDLELPLPILQIKIDLKLISGAEHFQNLLEKLKKENLSKPSN